MSKAAMGESYTSDEMMTVVAARSLNDHQRVFVGIGLPSAAANLARRLHAPNLVLIYESGTIGSKPTVLPLSIGDGELADTADTVVPIREIFSYWLEAGRIDVGFLGAAQIDLHANLNTTVVGDYDTPTVRLPGAGGAPEIAASAKEVLVVARHTPRTFVPHLDFVTSRGDRVSRIITTLGILERDRGGIDHEFVMTALYPGVSQEQVVDATGWPLRFAETVAVVSPPTTVELDALRTLRAQTAHAQNPDA